MDAVVRASLKQTGGVFLSIVPLFAFWFIAMGNSLTLLAIGLFVGTALTVILAILRLARGTLLWATAIFFGFALVAVFGLQNLWIIEHLGVFPSSIFFVAIMISMILDRPFIQEHAREGLTPEQQASASFARSCFVLSSFWAAVLLIMALVSVAELFYPGPGQLTYVFLQLGIVGAALGSQANYVVHIKRRRIAEERAAADLTRLGTEH